MVTSSLLSVQLVVVAYKEVMEVLIRCWSDGDVVVRSWQADNLNTEERIALGVLLRLSDLKLKTPYTTYSNPKGFIYQNKDKKNRLMCIDELHKFSDGTLNDVRERAGAMIQAIDRQLRNRRLLRSLEKFIGGRLFNTIPGNHVKEILLKLNLPDHRSILTDSKVTATKHGIKVKEFQRSFRHSNTERLSQSDEVLKLNNFKKDAALKLFKSSKSRKVLKITLSLTNQDKGTSSSLKSMITTSIHKPIPGSTRKGEVLDRSNRLLYKVDREIISDNGKQFRDNPFKDWSEKLNIKQRFAFVKHPQTNDQVERANRGLGEGIKARLGKDNRNWVEEVPHVLWAHHTMIKTSNRDTPFSLTYGTEAVIPVEIGMPSLRCAEVNQAKNDGGLLLNLDILEERREKAAVRKAKSKAKMEKYYNARVRSTTFCPGEFVYRSNEASNAKNSGKLGPKWKGPYEVVKALEKGAYKLRNGSKDILLCTWNIKDLKKCYL
ncbi:reverse transcriptase domain-containing protein [Tanacetum coccineum]